MLYSIDIDYDEIEKNHIKNKIEEFFNKKIEIFNENSNFDYILYFLFQFYHNQYL